jgi:hypothetical protein
MSQKKTRLEQLKGARGFREAKRPHLDDTTNLPAKDAASNSHATAKSPKRPKPNPLVVVRAASKEKS